MTRKKSYPREKRWDWRVRIGEMRVGVQDSVASSPQPHLSRDVVGPLGGLVGDLGRDHHYLGSSRVDMGSWARAGRGCTLHSGSCTARGLGPARVEVLSRGRKAVDIGKGHSARSEVLGPWSMGPNPSKTHFTK